MINEAWDTNLLIQLESYGSMTLFHFQGPGPYSSEEVVDSVLWNWALDPISQKTFFHFSTFGEDVFDSSSHGTVVLALVFVTGDSGFDFRREH